MVAFLASRMFSRRPRRHMFFAPAPLLLTRSLGEVNNEEVPCLKRWDSMSYDG